MIVGISRVLAVGDDAVIVKCRPCVMCGAQAEMTLARGSFMQWRHGALVQEAFPEMAIRDRELLISGTCSACFDNLMDEEFPF
jgi:hypothetical protein